MSDNKRLNQDQARRLRVKTIVRAAYQYQRDPSYANQRALYEALDAHAAHTTVRSRGC